MNTRSKGMAAIAFAFALSFLMFLGSGAAEAQTKYRNPLNGSPPLSAWMDHWHPPLSTNTNLRYDGTIIPSTSSFYYGNNPRHRGTDFAVSSGTAVYAAAPGTAYICHDGDPCSSGFGNWVAIHHSDGWYSIYAHLSSISVTLNQSVSCGTQVGLSGNTGTSRGAHLHFELRNGLSASDTSRDPFAGSESQATEYWFSTTNITDPFDGVGTVHYPTTTCQ